MKALLIVYHSMTGGTRQMAQAAADGARAEPGVAVSLLRADGGARARCARGGRLYLRDSGESCRGCPA